MRATSAARGRPRPPDALAQEAVGRLFAPDFKGDAQSWAAAQVLDQAPRTFNPFLLVWWSLTGAVAKARRLLADKVGHDPSGVHGVGVAVHNFVAAFSRMRALWAEPSARNRSRRKPPRRNASSAPQQVVRQPTKAGAALAGDFSDATLILLQLGAANARSPSPETAFMTQSVGALPGARLGSSVAGGGLARGAGVGAWTTTRSSRRSSSAILR